MKKYQITVTKDQAETIMEGLSILAEIGNRSLNKVFMNFPRVYMNEESEKTGEEEWKEKLKNIDEIITRNSKDESQIPAPSCLSPVPSPFSIYLGASEHSKRAVWEIIPRLSRIMWDGVPNEYREIPKREPADFPKVKEIEE